MTTHNLQLCDAATILKPVIIHSAFSGTSTLMHSSLVLMGTIMQTLTNQIELMSDLLS